MSVLVSRDGSSPIRFAVNCKRVYRLNREEGLKLRRKRRKQVPGIRRMPLTAALAPKEPWSMDFVSDVLSSGRLIRTLERAIELSGKPKLIVMDNGPEFTCRALDKWAQARGIALHWIDPGKPMQNAFAESLNGRFREECLDQHHFVLLDDARAQIESWREDYNPIRPHTLLGGLSPEQFLRSASEGSPSDAAPVPAQLEINPSLPERAREHNPCTQLGDRLNWTPPAACVKAASGSPDLVIPPDVTEGIDGSI
jgi:putative transposase